MKEKEMSTLFENWWSFETWWQLCYSQSGWTIMEELEIMGNSKNYPIEDNVASRNSEKEILEIWGDLLSLDISCKPLGFKCVNSQ